MLYIMKLSTIAKMAEILKVPESTARYYRDRHSEYLPFIGSGRKRRYKKQALEAYYNKRDSKDQDINNRVKALEEEIRSLKASI